MRRTIFVVHGIGSHPKDTWIDPVKATLQKAYEKYDSLADKNGAFDEAIDVQPISYDDIFVDILKSWTDSTKGIRDKVSLEQAKFVDKALDFVDALSANDKVRDYLLDLVFYTLVPTVRAWVLNRVGGAIVDHLSTHADQRGGHWSIIGHSMGTSVVHDALQQFSYDGRFNLKNTWAGTVMMIANCSDLLHDRMRNGYGVYESSVRPQIDPGSTLCKSYVNVKHHLDLATVPDPFKPHSGWATTEIITRGRYKEVAFNDARVRNIHALENYLENPLVHSELFRRMFVVKKKFEDELIEAAKDYDAESDLAKFEKLRVRLTSLLLEENITFSSISEIKTVLSALKEFFTTLTDL